jgi:hypothetical protein
VHLKAGDKVIKHGRSTKWTMGTVNECKAFHFEWHRTGEESIAISIVGDYCTRFCEPGDSGSMILNANGEAVAILFALEPGFGLSFAADIGATMADIERRTPLRNMTLLA